MECTIVPLIISKNTEDKETGVNQLDRVVVDLLCNEKGTCAFLLKCWLTHFVFSSNIYAFANNLSPNIADIIMIPFFRLIPTRLQNYAVFQQIQSIILLG